VIGHAGGGFFLKAQALCSSSGVKYFKGLAGQARMRQTKRNPPLCPASLS
jgi:hypothetical protein